MDIAALSLSVDSTQVARATGELDAFTVSATSASGAADKLSKASVSAATAQTQVATTTASATTTTTTAIDRMIASMQKQVDLFGASDAAIANYNASLAKMDAAQTASYTSLAAMLSQLQAEAKQLQTYYALQEAAAASGAKFIASLQEQIATLGMSESALLSYKAAQLGVSEAAAPLIAELYAQTAALEANAVAASEAAAAQAALEVAQAAGIKVAADLAAAQAAEAISEEAAIIRIKAMVAASRAETAALQDQAAATANLAKEQVAGARSTSATVPASAGAYTNPGSYKTTTGGANSFGATSGAADDAVRQSAKEADAVNKVIDALIDQKAKLSMTAEAYLTSTLSAKGATDAQIAMAVGLQKGNAALKDSAAALDAAHGPTARFYSEILVLGREITNGNFSKIPGSLTVLAQSFGGMSLILNPVTLAIAAFTAVTIGVAVAADKVAKSLADYGNAIYNIKTSTGDSTTAIQGLQYAIESNGGKAGETATVLDTLTKEIAKAEGGSKSAQAAFNAVGITMADLKSSTPTQVLGLVADAFSNASDGAGKYQVQQMLLGSTSKNLTDTLNGGSAGLDEWSQKLQALGEPTEAQIVEMKQLAENMDQFSANMSAIKIVAEASLLPTLLALSKYFLQVQSDGTAMDTFFKGLNETLIIVSKTIAAVVAGFSVWESATKAFAGTAANLITLHWTSVPDTLKTGWTDAGKALASYHDLSSRLDAAQTPGIVEDRASRAVNKPGIQAPTVGGTRKPNAGADLAAMQGDIDKQNAILKGQLANVTAYEKAIQGQYDSGVIDVDTYNDEMRQQYANAAADQIKAYNSEVATLTAGLNNSKLNATQRQDIQNKIEKDKAAAQKAADDYNIKSKKLDDDQNDRLAKNTAAVNAYVDALNTQIAAQAKAGDRAAAAVGLGSREGTLQSSIDSIQDAGDTKIDSLQKSAVSDPKNADRYTAEIAAQKKADDVMIQQTKDAYAKMTDAQNSFTNGATSAWSDFQDSANNVAAQTKSAFTTLFSNMTDSLTTFVTTGKLSFTSLVTSFLTDLTRMAVQAAESKVFGLLLNLVTGAAGGSESALSGVTSSVGLDVAGSAASVATSQSVGQAVTATPYAFTSGVTAAYANGGYVNGAGSSKSDSIHAKLSNGEFVVSSDVVSQPGNRALLEAMNGGKTTSGTGFANGGYVNVPQSNTSASGGDTHQVNFYLTNPDSSSQSTSSGTGAQDRTNSAAMQKDLENAVLQVYQKHSKPGGVINKTTRKIAGVAG